MQKLLDFLAGYRKAIAAFVVGVVGYLITIPLPHPWDIIILVVAIGLGIPTAVASAKNTGPLAPKS